MRSKKLLILAAVVVFVVIAALAAIPLLIDKQDLKPRLVTEAERILHRRMSVETVDITVFTGLGIRLNRVVIFDDLRFANAPFVALSSVTVRPRLLPLLRGSVEVASIELEKPEIRLIQNAQRVWNFESIGTAPAGPGGRPAPATTQSASSTDDASRAFAISQLDLRDGAVILSKPGSSGAVEESRYDHIYLKLRDFSTERAGAFDASLQLPPGAHALQLKGQLGPVQLASFSKTPVDGEIQFSGLPVARLASLSSAPVEPIEWQGSLTTATRLKGSLDQGFSLEGKTAYSKLGARRGALQSPQVDGEVLLKADYKASGALQFHQAELRMPASTLTMTGSVAGLEGDPALNLRIQSPKLAFDDLIKLAAVLGQGAPDGVQASGNGQLNLQVSGSSKKPQVAGEARLAEVWIRYPGLADRITLSPVVLAFTDNTVASNEIQISAGERTRLQAQWKAALGDPVTIDAQVRSAKPVPVSDLLAIASSFGVSLPEDIRLQEGSIDLQLAARQTLGKTPALSLQGQAALSGSKVQTAVLKAPMEVHHVQLQFTGQSASIPSLSASFAGSKLGGKLQITNFETPTLQFALNVDRLDLGKLEQMINTRESPAPAKPAEAAAAKASSGDTPTPKASSVKSRPAPASQDPLGRLTVRDSSVAVDTVSYDNLRLTKVSSKIQMKNRVLQLQDLKFNMNQGTHIGAASFDFNGAQPRYTFNSKLRDVDANEFLTQNTSLKNLLYGRVSSDFNLQGSGSGFDEISKQLKGAGKVTVAKGKITSFNLSEQVAMLGKLTGLNVGQGGTEFEDLVSEMTIADGRINTNAMHFRASGMALKVRGSLGLDRSADYQVAAELPPALTKKNSNQFFNLANATFFQNESGNAVIPLRMAGDIARPRLSLDTQMVKENLKNTLREGGVTKALDTFQGLLKNKKTGAETPDDAAESAQPAGDKPAEDKPQAKPAAKPGLEGLFQGIMDQVKEKKKEPKQEPKP
jgi:uncharacterized protein involved in outer membrane biogenesis